MSKAYDKWSEFAEEANRMRVLLQRCAAKMMNKVGGRCRLNTSG